MESASSNEHTALINELTQGMEQAKQLRFHLYSTSPSESQDFLVQRILASYEKALSMLNCGGTVREAQAAVLTPGAPESSVTVDGSPKSEELGRNFGDHQDNNRSTPKKRKLQPTWTEQVRINSENGLEGPTDEYSWRKYGQKDILGATYPRSYYRCTYRQVQDCWATKQVQRSDDNPTIFEITYKGTHTCNQCSNPVQPPKSPEKQQLNHQISHNHQPQQHNETLMNLKANLRVETEDIVNKNLPPYFTFPSTFTCYNDNEINTFPLSDLVDDNQLGAYCPTFYSPATSESNYFSAASYQMNYGEFPSLQHSGNDIAEIISAHASTTNSPIGGMEFPIDHLDPNFHFNNTGFFT